MNTMSMNMSGMGIMGTPATSAASGFSTTYQPPPPPYRSPGYAPRGPSADRDRERDGMDWERDRQRRSRVRGPPGWGR